MFCLILTSEPLCESKHIKDTFFWPFSMCEHRKCYCYSNATIIIHVWCFRCITCVEHVYYTCIGYKCITQVFRHMYYIIIIENKTEMHHRKEMVTYSKCDPKFAIQTELCYKTYWLHVEGSNIIINAFWQKSHTPLCLKELQGLSN